MRSTLYELPVLLTMLRAGVVSGGAAYLFLLPRNLFERRRRGLRRGFWRSVLFFVLDTALCIVCGAVFASALVYGNGGEIRLYAAAGYCIALFVTVKLLKTLFI